jgi:hypothetical protein
MTNIKIQIPNECQMTNAQIKRGTVNGGMQSEKRNNSLIGSIGFIGFIGSGESN